MMDPRDIAIWIATFIVAMIPIGMALWALVAFARRKDEEAERYWEEYNKKRGDKHE